jgi:hypothetical protein
MTTLNGRYPAIQGEFEDEHEAEDEAFFGGLAKIAGSLLGEGEEEGEYEFEFEAEAEAELEAEGELEDEFEAEAEEEAEGFVNPVRRVYRDAELMAHFATKAAESETEAEAEAFIGALIPLAAKLIPRAAKLIQANGPTLIKGVSQVARRMRRSPQGRRLVKALPVVLQRTAQSLADQAAAGRPIDATTVLGTLGDITGRVMRPQNQRSAVRAVDVFNRRYHRRRRWQATQSAYGRPAYGQRRRVRYGATDYRRVPQPRRTPVRRGARGARRY